MSGHDDHHGASPAAWTTVGILLLGTAIIAVGFVAQNLAVIVVGALVALLGLLIGRSMQARGLGVRPPARRRPVTLD